MKKIIYITVLAFGASSIISGYGQNVIIKDAGKTANSQVSSAELRSGKTGKSLPVILATPDTTKKSSLHVEILQAGLDSVRPASSDTLRIKASMFRWRVEKDVK